jgi:cell division protein FtsQ
MWDDAALLRNIANTMLAFSAIAVLYGSMHYALHLPEAFPLRSVRLSAVPQRVDAEQVLQLLRTEVRGNLVSVDIEHMRQSLEKLPWVRSVNIRREFPGRLAVHLEEHQPLARWNDDALVNLQGEVFAAEIEGGGQVLPSFTGPAGTSAEVSQQYAEFGRQLAGLDLHATKLVLSPRHAWQLRLGNGMVLELGREDVQQRLARFVAVYPYSLAAIQSRVKFVDLRYRNGFAVSGLTKRS